MHPFIANVSSRYEGVLLACSDHELALKIARNRDGHEKILMYFACLGGKNDLVSMTFQAKTKYPLVGARQKKYFKALAQELNEYDLQLTTMSPCTIELKGLVGHNTFENFSNWDDVSPYVDFIVHSLVSVLQAATFVVHINYRLKNRGGSQSYHKLLPSRLAELTVCGLYDLPQ